MARVEAAAGVVGVLYMAFSSPIKATLNLIKLVVQVAQRWEQITGATTLGSQPEP